MTTQARKLEVWGRNVTRAEVWSYVVPHVRAAGFEGPRLAEGAPPPGECEEPWEQVSLGGRAVFLGLLSMSEGCVLFDLMLRPPALDAALSALWEALLREPPRWLGECTLRERAGCEETVLIHSFARLAPTVAGVDNDDGPVRWVVPGDDDYWSVIGRQRRFLADWLLAEESTPSADEIAALYAASVERVCGGVVLNCGWTG